MNGGYEIEYQNGKKIEADIRPIDLVPVSYTHLTLPTNREV